MSSVRISYGLGEGKRRIERMKARKKYTGEFKASLVAEYIKGEKTLVELAIIHQVHPNQIKNWKSILLKRANEVLDDRRSHDEEKHR
jgi:transposase-like protein